MNFNETKIKKKALKEKSQTSNFGQAIFDEKRMKSVQKKKEIKPIVKQNIGSIIPIVDITANGYIELRNGEYMEIVQLTTKDVYSLNQEDKEHNIYSFAFFLQSYLEDIKIVSLNFPVDTTVQQQNILRKIERTENLLYVPFLQKKLNELRFIEKNRTHREYYLFIYSENEYTLKTKTIQIERLLQRTNPIIQLTEDKKISIAYKLNNLNSKTK